uniref:Uncharacterized protein n=1 Tax=Leviviridae sp. TaxID=2027243 RepID=A0A514D9K3_9VIRU|nr:MAG: hypothetical protein H2RhizoLitter491008_000003 [Leviviridae sp.]
MAGLMPAIDEGVNSTRVMCTWGVTGSVERPIDILHITILTGPERSDQERIYLTYFLRALTNLKRVAAGSPPLTSSDIDD